MAEINVRYELGRPAHWAVDRQVGDHCATWTYLDKPAADAMAARVAMWPDDEHHEGWPLAHLYEYEDKMGR